MKMIYILTLLLPVAAAVLLGSGSGKKHWRGILCAATAVEMALTILTAVAPKASVTMFSFLGLSFCLAPDTTGSIFAVLFSVLFFAAAVFATEYLEHDENPGLFSGVYLVTLAALLGLSWAGDLGSYYMFFECLTLASFPLILHDKKAASRKAAEKYLCYSLMGAALVLFGLVYIHRLYGSLEFIHGGYSLAAGNENEALAVAFVSIMGFGCKAGIMPLHDWLPTAHPQAPAPASAILSGCVTKAGLLGILRLLYFVFGVELVWGTWLQYALIAIALVTVFCGSMLAYKERILKKRLAYSTVSQVSYALFGLFLMSTAGFVGAMLQVLFHAVTKVCLFLCSGAVIHKSSRERVYLKDGEFQYYGLGKAMPLTMLGFTLSSLSLVGLPPFGGFVSKWYLAEGSFAALGFAGWIGAAVLLASALLTAGYLLSISAAAFFPSEDNPLAEAKEATWRMTVPILALSVALAVLGIYSFGYAETLMGLAAALM